MRMGIRRLWFLGLAVVLATAGCGGTSTPAAKSTKKDASKPSDKTVVAELPPKPPDDGSLSPEQYARFGLPALDRDWSGDDLATAERILTGLSKRGFQTLPKYQSERSGTVFARLTSAKNLELLVNKSLKLDTRFSQAVEYSDASNRILKLYLAGYVKKGVGENDLIELIGAQLRLAVVMLDLVDEWLPTLKQDDPAYQSRLQGVEGMKQGLASIVAGSLQTLRARGKTPASDITRLVGYMQETFPRIVSRLPLESRLATLVEVTRLRDDPEMQDLQPKLQELQSSVKASMDKTPPR